MTHRYLISLPYSLAALGFCLRPPYSLSPLLHLSFANAGKADEIDCTYVNSGLPTDVNAYIKSKQGFGKSFVDFFSDGGLIKFNPFK